MTDTFGIINRLMKIDDLISKRKTGSAKEFARKLKISRSHLFNHMEELKELGVEITYNKSIASYEYSGDMVPEIKNPLRVIHREKS